MRPDVSVVIPTLNRWGLLQRALGSALSQERLELEVIVVNDGSREPAPRLVRERPGARVVDHPQRRGVAHARNTGLAEARAPWIAFLDDDDLWAPTRLEALLDLVRAERSDFAYSSAVVVDSSLRPLYLQRASNPQTLQQDLMRGNAIPGGGSAVLARAELLRDLGGFDTAFSYAADWELWIRLAEAGRASSVDEPLVAYTHHTGSWVLQEDQAVRDDLVRLEGKHASVSPDRRAIDRSTGQHLWLAGKRRAAIRTFLSAARRHRDYVAPLFAARACFSPGWSRWMRRTRAPDPSWLANHRHRHQPLPQGNA